MKAKYKIRIFEAEMKFMRRTTKYTWMDDKTKKGMLKGLKSQPVLDNILKHKSNWIQHVDRM
jgi:hypothetical protein